MKIFLYDLGHTKGVSIIAVIPELCPLSISPFGMYTPYRYNIVRIKNFADTE